MSAEDLSVRFKPRKKTAGACRRRVKSGCASPESACRTIVTLTPGTECPNCRLANLEKVEGRKVVCPVCGYGTHRPVT